MPLRSLLTLPLSSASHHTAGAEQAACCTDMNARQVLLPISISTLLLLLLLQHPLAIRGTMTWLGFTPLHFIVDGSLQQMVPYL